MREDAGATGLAFNRSATARLRALIMAGQVAVACLLLAGAALVGRTFLAMLDVDRGYDPANVLTATIATPPGLFTDERRSALVDRVLERLRARPDVVVAGATVVLPLSRGDMVMAMQLPPLDGSSEPRMVQTGIRIVSPGYFEAMGMRTLEGRTFTDRDTSTSMPAVVVNRAFRDRYLPDVRAGRRLPLTFFEGMPEWELIGVVDNVRMRASVVEEPGPEIFVSHQQAPGGIRTNPIVVLRTRTDPASLIVPLRQIVAAEEPSAALESVMTMEERVMGSLARPRMYAAVLGGFAVFALTIASVGLFGVLSYAVAQRSKEFGVRAALGARRTQLVAMVLRQGLAITAAGIAVGLLVAALSARALSSYLFGVPPVDPVSFSVVALLLLVVALVACAVPAVRAAHVDPLTAIRQE
jgi:putative ABC transport system permease protein